MKICIISPLFDPWTVGGAERYAKDLAEELAIEHQVVVITSMGPTPRKQNDQSQNLKIIEINPTNISTLYDMINTTSSTGLIRKLSWHFLNLWNISSYMKIKKY